MMLADFFGAPVDRKKRIKNAERILYGSDYRHIPYSMERKGRAILTMDLGEELTWKIFYENAKKLFPIKLLWFFPRIKSLVLHLNDPYHIDHRI